MEIDIKLVCAALKAVYGKPLPWHRILFYSFAENKQYLKDKVKEYITVNS